MRTPSKLEDTHNLSVFGPDEKRIPIMRKREMANRLMLSCDEFGDDLRMRRGAAVYEWTKVKYFDVRARGKRITSEQGVTPVFDVARGRGDPSRGRTSEMGMLISVSLIVIVVPATRCRRTSRKEEIAYPAHDGSSLVLL